MNSRQFSNNLTVDREWLRKFVNCQKKSRWARNDANKRGEVKKVTETRAQTVIEWATQHSTQTSNTTSSAFFSRERRKMQISPTIPNGVKAQNRVSTRSFWIRHGSTREFVEWKLRCFLLQYDSNIYSLTIKRHPRHRALIDVFNTTFPVNNRIESLARFHYSNSKLRLLHCRDTTISNKLSD